MIMSYEMMVNRLMVIKLLLLSYWIGLTGKMFYDSLNICKGKTVKQVSQIKM